MAKSTYKFLNVTVNDLSMFMKRLNIRKRVKFTKTNVRAKTINKWNYRFIFVIPQGKYSIKIKSTVYHIGYKFGEFAKTRKPFVFRSKKKNVK